MIKLPHFDFMFRLPTRIELSPVDSCGARLNPKMSVMMSFSWTRRCQGPGHRYFTRPETPKREAAKNQPPGILHCNECTDMVMWHALVLYYKPECRGLHAESPSVRDSRILLSYFCTHASDEPNQLHIRGCLFGIPRDWLLYVPSSLTMARNPSGAADLSPDGEFCINSLVSTRGQLCICKLKSDGRLRSPAGRVWRT